MTKACTRYVLAGALAIGLAFPLCSTARADHDWAADCHNRLQADKARIDRDATKYGDHSAKVNHDVERMENDRAWCRDHHADWDHSLFDVGIYLHH